MLWAGANLPLWQGLASARASSRVGNPLPLVFFSQTPSSTGVREEPKKQNGTVGVWSLGRSAKGKAHMGRPCGLQRRLRGPPSTSPSVQPINQRSNPDPAIRGEAATVSARWGEWAPEFWTEHASAGAGRVRGGERPLQLCSRALGAVPGAGWGEAASDAAPPPSLPGAERVRCCLLRSVPPAPAVLPAACSSSTARLLLSRQRRRTQMRNVKLNSK